MTEQEKREKVIDALGECIDYFDRKVTGVMFNEWLKESRKAIALLKKQAPVKPVVDIDTLRCGYCGHTLEHQQLLGDNVLYHEQYDYCPQCGKAVAWK